jgi:hypothetical protein
MVDHVFYSIAIYTHPPKFSLKMALKKPKNVAKSCKFTKLFKKKCVLDCTLMYYFINRETYNVDASP